MRPSIRATLASSLSASAGNFLVERNRVHLDEMLDDLKHSLRSDGRANVFLDRHASERFALEHGLRELASRDEIEVSLDGRAPE